ncbi:four helix bundle protein [Prevotellaceae bacterium HUN156]|jgi:four helix bundle protein|nr:four helix bundle protein [Prevotellaceae bacterium HUN156]
MPRKESILKLKTEAFAVRITKLYKYLVGQKESVISKQIYRSGTSIGANVAESINAQSPADFISKLSIALKEANETEYWLKTLYQGQYIDENGFQSMFNDNEEIIKILVKSIKTIKKRESNEE